MPAAAAAVATSGAAAAAAAHGRPAGGRVVGAAVHLHR